MAQKVQVVLVDDVDGGAAEETVTFALDGVSYEIDLSADHATELRDSFARWVGHARKVGSGSGSGARGGSRAQRGAGGTAGRRPSGSGDATAIREWAREHGYEVSERGRISAEIRSAYEAAH